MSPEEVCAPPPYNTILYYTTLWFIVQYSLDMLVIVTGQLRTKQ